MLTVPQAAAKFATSRRNILQWIANGRLKGCEKFGNAWAVPDQIPEPPRKPGAKPNLTRGTE